MYKSNNISKDFSEWENDDVNSWLESIKLDNLIEFSKRNEITGYDLCVLSNEEIKKILGINSPKDLNILSKNIKIKILDLSNLY